MALCVVQPLKQQQRGRLTALRPERVATVRKGFAGEVHVSRDNTNDRQRL